MSLTGRAATRHRQQRRGNACIVHSLGPRTFVAMHSRQRNCVDYSTMQGALGTNAHFSALAGDGVVACTHAAQALKEGP